MKHSVPESAAANAAPIHLRPFAPADAPEVADLFVAEMLKGRGRATPALARYFQTLFLEGPFADPDCPARVAVDPEGLIRGFTGAIVQRLEIDGAIRTIAMGTTLMVRDHAKDPMTGARLLRALLSGPQDATLTETASAESLPMWDRLGGVVIEKASLEWVRVLRPAAMALTQVSGRFGPARWLSPLARPFDAWALRRTQSPTWTSVPGASDPKGVSCRDLTPADFSHRVAEHLAASPVRPLYDASELADLLETARAKSGRGTPVLREILAPGGQSLGAVLYHARPGGIARLHTLLARPGREGVVLDAVLADARDRGAAALAGRCEPLLAEALTRRRAVFLRTSATVVHSRDTALREAFTQGRVPLNGLFGERWIRLIGDNALWQ